MRRERVNEGDLRSLLRLQQIDDLSEVKLATLEPNGELSVIKADRARELRKGDLRRAHEEAA